MIAAAGWWMLLVLSVLALGFAVGYLMGGAGKLGGPEDGRPGPTPDSTVSLHLYPRDPWDRE